MIDLITKYTNLMKIRQLRSNSFCLYENNNNKIL